MKRLEFIFLVLVSIPLFSCSQNKNNLKFDEKEYVFFKKGADLDYPNYPYVIILKSKSDSDLIFKKVFLDSNYTQLLSKTFFYKKIPEGPFYIYANGQISRQGTYKKGQWDGERITYQGGKIVQKANFKNGIKVGVWEEYNTKGELIKKTEYDNAGNLVSEKKVESN